MNLSTKAIQSLPMAAILVLEMIETILIMSFGWSSASSVSETLLPVTSNLSCYVCSTIADINCKYLNETLNRHHTGGGGGDQSIVALADNGAAETYSSHRYILDPSSQYASMSSSQEEQINKHSNLQPDIFNNFRSDCLPTEQYCIVQRFGFSALDNVQEFNFFALTRKCADQCQDGCFFIGNGERTKLSICTSCCTENYCNVGNFATFPVLSNYWIVMIVLFQIIAAVLTNKIS